MISQALQRQVIRVSDTANGASSFHERLFLAWTLWQGKHQKRLTQPTLAEMLRKAGGPKVAQNTVSTWFNDTIPWENMVYLARALEVDPGWLAFGKASLAPGPHDPVLEGVRSVPRRRKD